MIRSVRIEDATEICEIYNHYVLQSIITFEEDPVSKDKMSIRISSTLNDLPWIVYTENKKILGFAYASKWKSRCAYKNSVESTVYVKNDYHGKKIGSQLYQELMNQISKTDIHAVIGGIALPNDHSIALHERFGFEKVAHFKEVGFKFNQWIDVGYWQKLLN
ncbi:arsinothricin resistance N-acetyltransferase ArsN1 family B [Xanthovirga aplysinae]|uniref:arsinothricin resistance N-acetyltransferase ArsN1 family B n=1 Tax=Xanthovirga aplysinae TaxID=2529853 RepID=UPI0012BB8C32|nr:arsinothricin resistance N-acetyltransferase ArsN1 family B [Xanthovirga aplysinae]MTI31481.1 N-acetyltransferase family protein [Xanthovirga aplysinae]